MSRKRLIISIVLCLALGAISMIAVAWLCAAFINPESREASFHRVDRDDGGQDVVITHRGFGHSRINRAKVDELILDDAGNIRTARWSADSDAMSTTRAGWPLRAFECENPSDVALQFKASAMRVRAGPKAPRIQGGWQLADFQGGAFQGTWRAVPHRPIWSGLIANIVIHAAIWFGLIFGVAMLRRKQRIAAGRCGNCGYDLRSSGIAHERCPECGK